MKVMHVGKYFSPFKGGMEDHLYNLCLSIKDKVQLELLVFNHKKGTSVEQFYGNKLIRLSRDIYAFSTPMNFSILKYIREFDGDVIHLHEPNPIAALACLIGSRGKKIVITYHYDIVKQKYLYLLYKFIQNKILSWSTKIIVTARNNMIYSQVLPKYMEKCVVIPLGIDVSKFELTDQIRTEATQIQDTYKKKIVLFVGRLTYYKGVEYLLKAVVGLDCTLLVIGKGDEEARLKEIAKETDNIVFLKNVEDLVPYYYASTVFVLPSIEKSEAFGIVQLEAMACQLPVICTNLKSGVPEVQVNGETGIVVEPKDSEALRNSIQFFLDNPEEQQKFGVAARNRVLSNYTTEINAKAHIDLYENL